MDIPIGKVALGYVQLVGLASAVGLPSIPAGANMALVTVSGQAVRYRDDGTAPTATTGVTIPTGVLPFQFTGNLAAVSLIQVAATATLDVLYYKVLIN